MTVIPSWMLDAAVCAGMELGEPAISLSGLAALHRLLKDIGVGQNSRKATSPFREETDNDCLARSSSTLVPNRTGVRITPVLRDLSPSEHLIAMERLASLLMQAAEPARQEGRSEKR